MSNPYITNSDMYRANAERDISIILSRFNSNYIYDCIDNAIENKNRIQFIMENPNLVRSLEDSFKIILNDYPDDRQNILDVREETYKEIIDYLCSKFNIIFNDDNEVDLYTAAFYLYDLLAGGYMIKMCKFFSVYISNEQDELYKAFELDKFKKNININYGKKLFKDNSTTIIIQQVSYVIDQLMAFDFDFETIVNIVYDNNEIATFINSLFDDSGYFYNFYKTDLSNPYIRPILITHIRLLIQERSMIQESYNFTKEG